MMCARDAMLPAKAGRHDVNLIPGAGFSRLATADSQFTLEMPDYEPAVILSACRTPIGSFGGALKDLSAADLGAVAIRAAICRAGVEAKDLGDVIMGCVLQAGAGMNVARQAALKAGVPQDVPGGDGEPRLRLGAAGGRARR